MKAHITFAICTFFAGIPLAFAEELTITQEGKAFSEKNVTIEVGDRINFVNNDRTTHNIYSRTKGHQFDVGAQRPGTSETHTFLTPGEVKIRCAIHPRMKLTVKVE